MEGKLAAQPALAESGTNLEKVSLRNIQRIRTSFLQESISKGLFTTEEQASARLKEEIQKVRESFALTVNLSPASIDRFFSTGQQDTFWDHLKEVESIDVIKATDTSQSKSIDESYVGFRETAEKALRVFCSQPVDESINPVYAGVAGGVVNDLTHGACEGYGNYFLLLDPTLKDKAVFNFCDSFANVKEETTENSDTHYRFDDSNVLSFQDAFEAKAIVNLMREFNGSFGGVGNNLIDHKLLDKLITLDGFRSGYIESIVFSKITTETIAGIGITLEDPQQLPEFSRLISKFPQLMDKMSIFIDPIRIGQLTTEWLSLHFPHKVQLLKPIENGNTQDVWKLLDTNAQTSFDDMQTLLGAKSNELLKRLKRNFVVDRHQVSSLGLVQELQRRRIREPYLDISENDVNTLLVIETARCFFSVPNKAENK